MNFNFNETAGAAQSSARQGLTGNAIHTVKFKGCEAKDIEGKQDHNAGTIYKVLDIKFENEDGYFTRSIFEPKDSDFQDRETQYGPNPSNVKSMRFEFKHLIDAVNPELAAKIDSKEKEITAKNWDDLRELMVKACEPGIDTEVQIKLLKNNKGIAIFPYFAAYNKEGKIYIKSNFIGKKLFFTPKEQEAINKAQNAKPSTPGDTFSFDKSAPSESLGDLPNFSL